MSTGGAEVSTAEEVLDRCRSSAEESRLRARVKSTISSRDTARGSELIQGRRRVVALPGRKILEQGDEQEQKWKPNGNPAKSNGTTKQQVQAHTG